MRRLIEIIVENTQVKKQYELGTSLFDVIKDQEIKLKYPILGAMVNNQLKELGYEIFKPKTIRFFDITTSVGLRMYQRSLCFVLYKAVKDLYPGNRLKIEHTISGGLYCEIEGMDMEKPGLSGAIDKLKSRMTEIIKCDFPIIRQEMSTEEAIRIFEQNSMGEKANLLKTRGLMYSSVYHLDDTVDYYYGCLVPSTSYLSLFGLIKYYEGLLLICPDMSDPENLHTVIVQNKLFDIFREHKEWAKILNVPDVASLNQAVQQGYVGEIIKVAEALQEKKMAQIADTIYKNENVKIILIAGPSSSGKTTFAKRLSVQLRVLGLKPVQLSLDNYFVDRENTPKDEHGQYDFEAFETIDVALFNENIRDLLEGKEVHLPKFSFTNGSRHYVNEMLKISNDNVIIIEGIHALNPRLTPVIGPEKKFRVYVSALTQFGIDSHNRIPTTDNRLIRRIVRDHKYRGYSALDTLQRWESVRRGEDRNIFPFQEEAEVMFNTSLLFEFGVLKRYAEPLLGQVLENNQVYYEAKRLLKFLSYFLPISEREIPPTSILREFLGGSSFGY
ncbi:MAG: nucleoside kinase [Bacteroidia bacterium]|nr:nucleoside kinase [Bacteroidia bacterium]